MRTRSVCGVVATVRMRPPLLTLLWLGLILLSPITGSVVLADGSHADQELTDLLRLIQEETSLSREWSQFGDPSWLEAVRTGADGVEVSRSECEDFPQAVRDTISGVVPENKVPGHCPWVPACGSRKTC